MNAKAISGPTCSHQARSCTRTHRFVPLTAVLFASTLSVCTLSSSTSLAASALASDPQPKQPDPAQAKAAEPKPSQTKPADSKPAETKPASTPSAPPAAPPSLDELLGIKPAKPSSAPTPGSDSQAAQDPAGGPAVPAPDATKQALDRLLKGEEMGDAFQQAVALMDDAARRLTSSSDPGLETQRLQEDVIKRLDQLLSSLNQQQQSSSSSSSSSSSQQQQQQQQQKAQQQRSRQQSGGTQPGEEGQGDGNRQDLGPGRQDGALNPPVESARSAWGNLPARIRDTLMQGSADRFSARYKQLTEEYYKRLAEQNSK